MKKLIAITALSFLIMSKGWAQQTPGIDGREHAQRARIHEGRHNGDLTRREAHRLNRQQRHIHRDERRAKADGTVTRAERHRLHKEQNRASRSIRRQKHDQQARN